VRAKTVLELMKSVKADGFRRHDIVRIYRFTWENLLRISVSAVTGGQADDSIVLNQNLPLQVRSD